MKVAFEIVRFDVEDIITASGGFTEGDSESGSGSGQGTLVKPVNINN